MPRSRKGALTRARLIDAAKEVFEESGFLETRISDIAERAGLSHGSFYHYFDSKEQVFREVAEAQEDLLTAPPTPDGDEDAPAASEHERILQAHRPPLEPHPPNGHLIDVTEEATAHTDQTE